MQKRFLFLLFLTFGFSIQSQTISKDFRVKTIFIEKDTVPLDSVAINPYKFKVFNINFF